MTVPEIEYLNAKIKEWEDLLLYRDFAPEIVQYIQISGSPERVEGLAVARYSLMFTVEHLISALAKHGVQIDEVLCKELEGRGLDDVEVGLCLGILRKFIKWINSTSRQLEPMRYVFYPPEPDVPWDF